MVTGAMPATHPTPGLGSRIWRDGDGAMQDGIYAPRTTACSPYVAVYKHVCFGERVLAMITWACQHLTKSLP
jgi:hypothetical protein